MQYESPAEISTSCDTYDNYLNSFFLFFCYSKLLNYFRIKKIKSENLTFGFWLYIFKYYVFRFFQKS
jgi:hypothetical protein